MAEPIHSLIIGGTRGIGLEQVKTFAARDHVVSVIARRAPEHVQQIPNVHYWSTDLTDPDGLTIALREVVERSGKLRNLIFFQRYRGTTDDWSGEIETTLTATRNTIEQLLGQFETGGQSSIVLVGSMASNFIAAEQPLSYHVGKAGLIQIARYYAATRGPAGIRVNCVTPGAVLKEESKDVYLNNPGLYDLYRRITPLRRMATAREIVNVISFLCSPEASFITGQNIIVDGGLSLLWQESLSRNLAGDERSLDQFATNPTSEMSNK